MPADIYKLTILGNSTIHDLAGNRLDGEDTGSEGTNYVSSVNYNFPSTTIISSLQLSYLSHELMFPGGAPHGGRILDITCPYFFSSWLARLDSLARLVLISRYDAPADQSQQLLSSGL